MLKPNAHSTQNCFFINRNMFRVALTANENMRNCEVTLLQNGGVHEKEESYFDSASYNGGKTTVDLPVYCFTRM